MVDVDQLWKWCLSANAVSFSIEGIRNTCIHTSLGLAEFLRRQGLDADVFRAEAHMHCGCSQRCYGSALGWDGDGTRRPKSDGWRGHLAVSCGEYVLDPTLDQMETGCGARPSPAVFRKPAGWDVMPLDRPWEGGALHTWTEGDLHLRHRRYRRQVGWKSKPAARPSRWLDIAELIGTI